MYPVLLSSIYFFCLFLRILIYITHSNVLIFPQQFQKNLFDFLLKRFLIHLCVYLSPCTPFASLSLSLCLSLSLHPSIYPSLSPFSLPPAPSLSNSPPLTHSLSLPPPLSLCIYYHHQVLLIAMIPLILLSHLSLSFNVLGGSSSLEPEPMLVFVRRKSLECPYVGVHSRTLLLIYSQRF